MKHKKLFVTFTVIFSVLVAFIIFFMIWFWGDRYNDFDDFRSEIAIPGLKDGACPQGIATYKANYTVTETDENGEETEITKQQDYFFISAYFKNQPSRIYVVGKVTGEVGYVTLKNVDGSDYMGHCGGIATNGYYIWVSSDDTVFVANGKNSVKDNIALDLISLAEEHGSIQFTASFNANCNASFLYYYDADGDTSNAPTANDYLYVGEFYRAGNYETNEMHHLTTPNGETNRAFAYEYKVSNTTQAASFGLAISDGIDENGVAVPKIQKIFSLPNEIQGFARIGDKGIVLSESYGLKNSHIYYYDFKWSTSSLPENSRERYISIEKDGFSQGFVYDGATFKTSPAPFYDNSTSLYVYYIDSSAMLNDYSIPCMSEGLCTIDGRVYVLFESGAKKYSTFVRQVLGNVHSFIPRKGDQF